MKICKKVLRSHNTQITVRCMCKRGLFADKAVVFCAACFRRPASLGYCKIAAHAFMHQGFTVRLTRIIGRIGKMLITNIIGKKRQIVLQVFCSSIRLLCLYLCIVGTALASCCGKTQA